jgi:hypothetical protein
VALIGVGQGMGVRQQKLVDAISVAVVEQDEPKQQQKVCLKAPGDVVHVGIGS